MNIIELEGNGRIDSASRKRLLLGYPKYDFAGFLLGDGIWESFRLHEGSLVFIADHLDRLFRGAKAIALDIGRTREEILAAIDAFIGRLDALCEALETDNADALREAFEGAKAARDLWVDGRDN